MAKQYGPSNHLSDIKHAEKYRGKGESFREAMTRVANVLSDNEDHFCALRDILLDMRFLPGGRIQTAIGSTKHVTPYNCYVSGTIEDTFCEGPASIMGRAHQAAQTMRMGGGIGYDFSSLRPRGALIKKLQSNSSGPVPFMEIFDAVCRATSSAGSRRGAQMGVLRVDHPDIEEFIRAKQNASRLTGFNISVAITDEFMQAMVDDRDFDLRWGRHVCQTVKARVLWEMIMRSTYDWAEPGVLFIDRINEMNNLYYCEKIAATNPCGEQPLPPFGACLLGSFNLVRYLDRKSPLSPWFFDYEQFFYDIPHVVRAMDNVVDVAAYPLFEQEKEAQSKRRMGLGITGTANTIEALGHPYGSPGFIRELRSILKALRDTSYEASALLAAEKGAFPLYQRDLYVSGAFVSQLPMAIRDLITKHGMRNSHLLSIAPTGTISFCADNVSSSIEPVYAYAIERSIVEQGGPVTYTVEDYGHAVLGVNGKVSRQCSVVDHLSVLIAASEMVDSAVSKTCNLPEDITWENFKDVYFTAWREGAKGCTTYREGCLRGAVLRSADRAADGDGSGKAVLGGEAVDASKSQLRLSHAESRADSEATGDTCEIDPLTGRRNCE